MSSLEIFGFMWESATSEIVASDPHPIDIDANIDVKKSIFGATGSTCVVLVLMARSFGCGGIPV